MKKIKFLALTMSALLSVNFVWGDETTLGGWTTKPISGSTDLYVNGNLNDNKGNSWSVSLTGSASDKNPSQNVYSGTTYWQLGANGNKTTAVFSTSAISGTITKIVIDCAAYKGFGSVNVTVGGNNFGTQDQIMPTWTTTPSAGGGTLTFSGSASGAIVVTMAPTSDGRAIYLSSIKVTYTSAPTYTVTAQSNNTDLGTVSGTTTITASPEECVGYANPAYTVAPAGEATVAQSGNTFTISNVTADVTVTINFAALAKDTYDTYEDHLHGNATIEKCGSYTAPSLDDATKPTTEDCDVVHYHFAGWVTNTISTGTSDAPGDMVTAGTAMNSNGAKYIAVWAKEK